MNCQECQDVLDNMLVAEPGAAERAAFAEHLQMCPDCAGQYAQTRQALAAITPTGQFPVSHDLKKRIMAAISDAQATEAIREADALPRTLKRTRTMRRIAKLAVAATILVAFGLLVCWMTIGGGSTNIAFARVADALDHLRSATFDMTANMKDQMGGKNIHMRSRGFFLAPSHQRMESSIGDKGDTSSVMIMDMQTAKAVMLMPEKKFAVAFDGEQMKKEMEKSTGRPSPSMFEMVRRLVREGSAGTGEKTESLGTQELDGHKAVGFRTRPSNMTEMILWADPQTALPIRVEITASPMMEGQMVLSNFRYDVDLDPTLFSLEPPSGYTVQAINPTMPVEEDLLNTLRLVAEHNKGVFPAAVGMNKEFMQAVQAVIKPGIDKVIAKYGKESPEMMKAAMSLGQKHTQGVMFFMSLKPENDSHYAGGGVKLGTPDRPIFWYKPTGADKHKYRVIYADLSVKELTADAVKKLSEARSK